jgi:predicted nucleic acid-binding protein
VSEDIAVEAARIRHSKKIALADSLVLATAKSAGAEVVTGDPDFKGLDRVIYIGE